MAKDLCWTYLSPAAVLPDPDMTFHCHPMCVCRRVGTVSHRPGSVAYGGGKGGGRGAVRGPGGGVLCPPGAVPPPGCFSPGATPQPPKATEECRHCQTNTPFFLVLQMVAYAVLVWSSAGTSLCLEQRWSDQGGVSRADAEQVSARRDLLGSTWPTCPATRTRGDSCRVGC